MIMFCLNQMYFLGDNVCTSFCNLWCIRYFETFDMMSEEGCTTQLEWKESFAKCGTGEEKGTN